MPTFNKVVLVGNLTRDPELRSTPKGTAMCKIGLATNRKWKAKDNSLKTEAMFIDAIAWGRTAQALGDYAKKGNLILVEGRLAYQTWDTPEGQRRSRHEIVVESFQFLGFKRMAKGKGGDALDDEQVESFFKGDEPATIPPPPSMEPDDLLREIPF